MHPSAITETVLSRCTATELAAIAMTLGVPRTATRSKLSAKILATIELRLTLASATHEELQKLPGKELRSLLKRAGAYVPQNKYGMASALIGWREKCRLEGRASIAKAIHYLHVSRAVRMGLPVPADVLAAYPNMLPENNRLPLFPDFE